LHCERNSKLFVSVSYLALEMICNTEDKMGKSLKSSGWCRVCALQNNLKCVDATPPHELVQGVNNVPNDESEIFVKCVDHQLDNYENTTLRSKSEGLVAAALAFSRSITP